MFSDITIFKNYILGLDAISSSDILIFRNTFSENILLE